MGQPTEMSRIVYNVKHSVGRRVKVCAAEVIFACEIYSKYTLREMLQFVTGPDIFLPGPAAVHPCRSFGSGCGHCYGW